MGTTSGWSLRLGWSETATLSEFDLDLLRGQRILGQGPTAVAIDERLESRVGDRLRSLSLPRRYEQ